MCRLPYQTTTEDLDACFIGIPMDNATSNRSGTRFGPRQIRSESTMIRVVNTPTGADPFHSLKVADVGDVPISNYDLEETCNRITNRYNEVLKNDCIPLTLGGDHLLTFPILRAIAKKHGPVGLIHIDAHDDTQHHQQGALLGHGTPFYQAVQNNCLDLKRTVQIGLRGSGNTQDDYSWAKSKGFRVIPAYECYHKSLKPLMQDIRKMMGDGPVYITFDIDALDPCFAPGTGTPEVGGLTTIQGLEIVRGCRGLNIVGGDLVEVSPPYDTTGNTALTGANLLYEMLCVLPGVNYFPTKYEI